MLLFTEQHHGQLLPAFNICEQTILFLLPTPECFKANLRQNLVCLWVFQKASAVGYYIFHVSGLFTELQPPEKHTNHKWPWLILVFTRTFVTHGQHPNCAMGSFLLASSSGVLTPQGLTHPCSHTTHSHALAGDSYVWTHTVYCLSLASLTFYLRDIIYVAVVTMWINSILKAIECAVVQVA